MLAIPYEVAPTPIKAAERGVYVVFPTRADAVAQTKTEVRHRSLFKVPVYRSDIVFKAWFDLTGVPAFAPDGAVLDWNRAEFLVGATDARGAQADATISAGEKLQTLAPAAALRSVTVKLQQGGETQLTLFGARVPGVAQPNVRFDLTASLQSSGAQRLAILAFGENYQRRHSRRLAPSRFQRRLSAGCANSQR